MSETTPLTRITSAKAATAYDATGGGDPGRNPALNRREQSFTDGGESATKEGVVAHQQTTDFETVIHLIKGYLGAGMLSLPFAVSQLGIVGGILSIFALSFWTSSNCYTVVNIKRHMEKTTPPPPAMRHNDNDEVLSESSSNITYPEIGNWGYGSYFQGYVSACIITLQLAVCTVYVSFIGENLLAVAQFVGLPWVTHTIVMTIVLPFILGLAYLPNLKLLAPVMAAGTVLLLVTLAALGVIVSQEWPNRPDDTPHLKLPQAPLALCMILYSYEGINLILPVHAAMKCPAHFDVVFWLSMALVAAALAGVAVVSVVTFGNVTNGSLTAFLLDAYQGAKNSEVLNAWIMFANTTVSLSVLLTYPLTMYPAVELMGNIVEHNSFLARLLGRNDTTEGDGDDVDFEDVLAAFEPLPPLPEYDALPEVETMDEQHVYGALDDLPKLDDGEDPLPVTRQVSPAIGRIPFVLPGDSLKLRTALVLLTYVIAVSIPNVQALISLVGALAGSSAALLIPPVLELAWVEHLEHMNEISKSPALGTPPPSPYLLRKLSRKPKRMWWDWGEYVGTKIKCYLSFGLGFVFLAIGTGFSVMDIVALYGAEAGA